MIYLDNAATTCRKPPEVIEAVTQAMLQMGNSARGTHKEALAATRVIHEARELLAQLFHCSRAAQVVFSLNATEALNTVISGTLEAGDHVITTDLEHNSVLRPLYRLEREKGVTLSFVRADAAGRIDYNQFETLIQKNSKMILCTHSSNLTGNLLDISRVAEIARANGLLLCVDASQTAGVFPIDMQTMKIDILCFTGHKSLYGPQGTGGLCLNGDLKIRPLKVGGSGIRTYEKLHPNELPEGLEAGTLNGHGIAGLKAGVEFVLRTGIDVIREHEIALASEFYRGVCAIRNVKVYGDFTTAYRAPIVALNIGDYDSAQVSDELSEGYGIATRPGAHCAPRLHEALGTVEQGAVRFSFSWFNTMDEVEQAVLAIKELAAP